MRTGVFLNKLFINHTTFFQTNKDKSYRKNTTEPFAYRTVSQNVCSIRMVVVVMLLLPLFFSHTIQLAKHTSAQCTCDVDTYMNEIEGDIVRRTIVVTNSYNKCLTKSLEFFVAVFLPCSLSLSASRGIPREELYSACGREDDTNKKKCNKKTTDKSINLKIYITLYVVTCVEPWRHKTQSDTFKRLLHVHIFYFANDEREPKARTTEA